MPFATFVPRPIPFALVDPSTGVPFAGTPIVAVRKPGGSFAPPSGAIVNQGGGFFELEANPADQDTEGLLILWATSADGTVGCPASAWVGDTGGFAANSAAFAYPFWLTQIAAPNTPLEGAAGIALSVGLGGVVMAPPASTAVLEIAHGFYEWQPLPADVATAGQLDLIATANGAFPFYGTYQIVGGAITPFPPPTQPPPSATPWRERDIRAAVVALLQGSGEFDDVWSPGLLDPRGQASDDLRGCSVEPSRTGRGEGWDAETWGGWSYECELNVEIVVRHTDSLIRDELCERLLNVARNVLYGSIGGITLEQKTYVDSWTWLDPRPPERRIKCRLLCPYIEEGELDAGTAE